MENKSGKHPPGIRNPYVQKAWILTSGLKNPAQYNGTPPIL
jgi:hypothetical protein